MIHRDHAHDLIDEDTGDLGPHEQWRFTRVGDVQALVRWQVPGESTDFSWALTGGLKLPTGERHVANDDGTTAERSLQPGTGTTDVILGMSVRSVLGIADALNLQATWTQALAEADGFKSGRRLELSAGWVHAVSPSWSWILQANLSHRRPDSGAEAEPELSGSTTVNLSPGASMALGHDDTVYGFVQVPVYQKVNGIQLVPSWSLAVGWTRAF